MVGVEAAAGAVEAAKVAVACWEYNSLYPSTPVHGEITLALDFLASLEGESQGEGDKIDRRASSRLIVKCFQTDAK